MTPLRFVVEHVSLIRGHRVVFARRLDPAGSAGATPSVQPPDSEGVGFSALRPVRNQLVAAEACGQLFEERGEDEGMSETIDERVTRGSM